MVNFGYKANKDRQINLNESDFTLSKAISLAEPSFELCVQCGTCSATCTAAQFTSFSLRKTFLLIKRGITDEIKNEIQKCMFCGKCLLACPRGVNTRNAILQIQVVCSL